MALAGWINTINNSVGNVIKAATPVPNTIAPKQIQPAIRAVTNIANSIGKQNSSSAPTKSSSSRSSGSSGSSSYSGGSSGSSGGSSGGSGSGGAVGSGSYAGGAGAVSYAPPAPVTQDITIPDPLANPTYQRQKAELLRAKSDFTAQQDLAANQYNGTVNTNMRQMGWGRNKQGQEGWVPNDTSTAYGQAYQGNEGDFSGRGLINSGLYGQALGDLNNTFGDRRTGMLTEQKAWQDTQGANARNFDSQQSAADQSALSDAIAAIAAQYGVNLTDITPGAQHTVTKNV